MRQTLNFVSFVSARVELVGYQKNFEVRKRQDKTYTRTMNTRAALSVSLIGGILTTAYYLRPIRVVHVQGAYSSIYWTVRSWLWNYPVTEDYAIWDTGDPTDEQVFESDRIRLLRIWRFLRPFFVSHGYHPYVLKDPTDIFSEIVPSIPASTEKMTFPFAQRFYRTDDDAETNFFVGLQSIG